MLHYTRNIYEPNNDIWASPFFESTWNEIGKLCDKTKIICRGLSCSTKYNDKFGDNAELH